MKYKGGGRLMPKSMVVGATGTGAGTALFGTEGSSADFNVRFVFGKDHAREGLKVGHTDLVNRPCMIDVTALYMVRMSGVYARGLLVHRT
jgi:hypothetical protein